MAFDYTEIQEVADELIREFGATGYIRRYDRGTFDPGTGGYSQAEYVDYEVTVVVLGYDQKLIDGTLIRASDRRVLMSAKDVSVEPDPKTDKLLVGAASISGGTLGPLEVDGLPLLAGGATAIYEIVKAEQLRPAATTVLYELQARSA